VQADRYSDFFALQLLTCSPLPPHIMVSPCIASYAIARAEAALAVQAVQPDKYFDFCAAVWAARGTQFTDEATIDK
jgi:hypothetical protein